MPVQGKLKHATTEEKTRVLAAHSNGENWKVVAKHNGIALTTARRIVRTGQVAHQKRGGARPGRTKVTPEILAALERYLDTNCQYTLSTMRDFVAQDFPGTLISKQTISRHLLGMLYTVKQVRIEQSTCNSDTNKAKRKESAETLVQHQRDGNFIVYYDETNYNIYCHRSVGRSKQGSRACLVLPPSKGPNLQIQCAVSPDVGLVCYRMERGSIKMEQNAAFVEEVYRASKNSPAYQNHFVGKKIVIVLDNALAHSQTEHRVAAHEDMTLLRLGSYSPMLNPIESCFSVLKAHIKRFLAERTILLFHRREFHSYLESRMRLLEEAAMESLPCITESLVIREAMFCQRNVEKALNLENMSYGT
ncbi:hypothetical protein DYB26_015498 [Aphanomyces astaci]|uniref:Tc1-like transposase DDE domain-containing protein n=1 Tax=Aphanomyces astaci TaxID=112090 RepID=A0A3R6W796_APHAT|nr:hypothetical protein DYB26_015498 [Aphanomyces astaci]